MSQQILWFQSQNDNLSLKFLCVLAKKNLHIGKAGQLDLDSVFYTDARSCTT